MVNGVAAGQKFQSSLGASTSGSIAQEELRLFRFLQWKSLLLRAPCRTSTARDERHLLVDSTQTRHTCRKLSQSKRVIPMARKKIVARCNHAISPKPLLPLLHYQLCHSSAHGARGVQPSKRRFVQVEPYFLGCRMSKMRCFTTHMYLPHYLSEETIGADFRATVVIRGWK